MILQEPKLDRLLLIVQVITQYPPLLPFPRAAFRFLRLVLVCISMTELDIIQQSIAAGDYQYTAHAVLRTTERCISRTEIVQAVSQAEIIESYPDDKYGPSFLLHGITDVERHLHVLVSTPPVKIITAYEPDPDEWEDFRVRKTQND